MFLLLAVQYIAQPIIDPTLYIQPYITLTIHTVIHALRSWVTPFIIVKVSLVYWKGVPRLELSDCIGYKIACTVDFYLMRNLSLWLVQCMFRQSRPHLFYHPYSLRWFSSMLLTLWTHEFLKLTLHTVILWECLAPSYWVWITVFEMTLTGTKWTVFRGKKIHSTWHWKGSIVSAGIWTLDPWITRQTLYHWAVWLGDEWA